MSLYVFSVSGDFAILLKSGLTFKQALTYNLASAVISYIGLALGVIIGDIQSAHTWVLALTAGMFLYISLVDMVSHVTYLHFLSLLPHYGSFSEQRKNACIKAKISFARAWVAFFPRAFASVLVIRYMLYYSHEIPMWTM